MDVNNVTATSVTGNNKCKYLVAKECDVNYKIPAERERNKIYRTSNFKSLLKAKSR